MTSADSCRREYEDAFRRLVDAPAARAFARGREALVILLKALGVGKGDRVGVCGYTCLSVVEPVKLAGAVPVYLDVDEHACIDPAELARAGPGSLRVVILQHTFGVPGRLGELVRAAAKIGARVVEDCAHSVGCSWDGVPLGRFGDAAIYSTGWGKPYVTGEGGVLTVNSKDLLARVDAQIARLAVEEPPTSRPLRRAAVRSSRGGILTRLYDELRDIGPLEEPIDLHRGFRLRRGYVRVAGEMTCIAGLRQLDLWPRLAWRRRENAAWIRRRLRRAGLPCWPIPRKADVTMLAYPLLVANKRKVLAAARRKGLDVSGWYESPVHPLARRDLRKVDYVAGSCPRAEDLTRRLVHVSTASLQIRESLEEILRTVLPTKTRARHRVL